jgi:hypothetical protein
VTRHTHHRLTMKAKPTMTESIPAVPPAVTTFGTPTSYAWTTAGGGALIALGSFLPWMSATTIFGSFSKSGLDGGGDGIPTSAFAYANVGAGIWVIWLGAAVVFLGAFIGLGQTRGGQR